LGVEAFVVKTASCVEINDGNSFGNKVGYRLLLGGLSYKVPVVIDILKIELVWTCVDVADVKLYSKNFFLRYLSMVQVRYAGP